MICIFIGAPGSGKGTQADLLSQFLKCEILCIGNIVRKLIATSDPSVARYKNDLERGFLLPDEFINSIAKNYISNPLDKDYILDGYPRSKRQAEYLEELVTDKKLDIIVLCFNIDPTCLVERIIGRFACAKCGSIYHKKYKKTKTENICDDCGSAEFIIRADDNRDILLTRIHQYNAITKDIIAYYESLGRITYIDADRDVLDVFASVKNAITHLSQIK